MFWTLVSVIEPRPYKLQGYALLLENIGQK